MPRPMGTLLLVVAAAAALAVVGIGTAHGADLSPQQQSELVAYAKSECAAAGGTFLESESPAGACELATARAARS